MTDINCSPLHAIEVSAELLNNSIVDMLAAEKDLDFGRLKNGYSSQFDLINRSFKSTISKTLQKEDIATRLSLLDLFYTTNFNRFAEFGLYHLTEVIWNLCNDGSGYFSDFELARKVEIFVSDCTTNPSNARKSDIFKSFFSEKAKFGVAKTNDCIGGISAQSLISKYLFFLLENYHSSDNPLGFPIYDSIAKDLQNPLLRCLKCKVEPERDMVDYIRKMKEILDRLTSPSIRSSHIWQMETNVCRTQFGLLDYYLWRIGKSGCLSFSLLWSESEKQNHYHTAEKLKKESKNKSSKISQKYFNSLPLRFQKWFYIYSAIKYSKNNNLFNEKSFN